MLDEDEEEQDALFQEEEEDDDVDELLETESDTPPHLRDLASASELGDVDALRRALGAFTSSLIQFICIASFCAFFWGQG